eukprot:m.326876 g.326876  ORF g.326876 m.326876 type:complete len:170 (+) comp19745_c10_seq1:207-716(+)
MAGCDKVVVVVVVVGLLDSEFFVSAVVSAGFAVVDACAVVVAVDSVVEAVVFSAVVVASAPTAAALAVATAALVGVTAAALAVVDCLATLAQAPWGQHVKSNAIANSVDIDTGFEAAHMAGSGPKNSEAEDLVTDLSLVRTRRRSPAVALLLIVYVVPKDGCWMGEYCA